MSSSDVCEYLLLEPHHDTNPVRLQRCITECIHPRTTLRAAYLKSLTAVFE